MATETTGVEAGIQKLAAGIDGIGKRLDEQERRTAANSVDLAAIADKIKAQGPGQAAGHDTPEARSGFSIVACMRALHEKRFGKNPNVHIYESKAEQDVRERVMSGGIGPSGGFLIQPEYAAMILPELESQLVLQRAGAQTLTIRKGVGQHVIPRESSGPTFTHVGEGRPATESTPVLEQLIATPKRGTVWVRATQDVLSMAAVDVDPWIRRRMLKKAQLGMDLTGLRGTGSTFQPLGIVNLPGIGAEIGGATGGPVTLNLLQNLQTDVDAANAAADGHAWIMHARTFGRIRLLRDGFSRPLVEPNVKTREGYTELLGAPVLISNQLPINLTKGVGTNLGEIIYGRFSHLHHVLWASGVEIKVSDQASDGTNSAWLNNELWFKLEIPYDWLSEYEAVYAVANDIQTQ